MSARRSFAELMNRAACGNERVALKRRGKAMAPFLRTDAIEPTAAPEA